MSLDDFLEGAHQRGRGLSAEADAARWLESHGYRVVERNVTSPFGEMDLVGIDGDTLCFVEIKARRSLKFGGPLGAVTPSKRRRLARCASAYLSRRPWDGPCRFDVLGMWVEEGAWRYELIRNAFLVP